MSQKQDTVVLHGKPLLQVDHVTLPLSYQQHLPTKYPERANLTPLGGGGGGARRQGGKGNEV